MSDMIEQISKSIESAESKMKAMFDRKLFGDDGEKAAYEAAHLAVMNRIFALKAQYDEKLWQAASEVLDKISMDYDADEEDIAEATAAIAHAMSNWNA